MTTRSCWKTGLIAASVGALTAGASAQQLVTKELPNHPVEPSSVTVTPVLGVPSTLQPVALVANLDAGDLVAGRTWWKPEEQGFFWIETHVGFLWSPVHGMRPFEVPPSLYFNNHVQMPAEIAADGTVVGVAHFTSTFQSRPTVWTPADGFRFLPTPGGGWVGGATAVSVDGTVIAGSLQFGLGVNAQAARWVQGALDVFGPAGQHSFVSDLSDDGLIAVGAVGPDAASVQATRWLNGVETGLAPIAGAKTSTALFVSDDRRITIGIATVGGREVLARWRLDGPVTTYLPPDGLLIESINAINARGTAAVGALTDDHLWGQGDQTPFLWRLRDGFTLIDEFGVPEVYGFSRAFDVSDDGTRVVGQIAHWSTVNGQPPTTAFLWTESGTQNLEELLTAAGGKPLGLYDAASISGDGRRILVTGTERHELKDTTSVILEFSGPMVK